jgi:hypothetical protein
MEELIFKAALAGLLHNIRKEKTYATIFISI